jgi:hypothetical protein
MDIHTVRDFFMWCTIVNAALMLLSFLICASARDWIHRMHGKWFPMPKETFTVVLYCFFGVYKMLFLVFNITPYLALLIMG